MKYLLLISISMMLAISSASARPTNDQIIPWLNKNLAYFAGDYEIEKGSACPKYSRNDENRTSTDNNYKYEFSIKGSTLVINETKTSRVTRRSCDDTKNQEIISYSTNKIDLSTATTIDERKIVQREQVRGEYCIPYALYLEGVHIVVGRDYDTDEQANKVRRALNDLILNNGGSEPLY